MLEELDALVPEARGLVRRIPMWLRIVAGLTLVALVAAGRLLDWKGILAGLTLSIEAPLYVVALGSIGLLLLIPSVSVIAIWLTRRRLVAQFVREWLQFRAAFELLYVQMEGWLWRDPNSSFLEDIPPLQEFFLRQARLRNLLYRIGEDTLNIRPVPAWQALKKTEQLFVDRDYLTPFSLLLDVRAPVAEVNRNGSALWTAIWLSDDFLEYLGYSQPHVERIVDRHRHGVRAPNEELKPTAAPSSLVV